MWENFKEALYYSPKTKLMLDYAGIKMDDGFKAEMSGKLSAALAAMDALEAGAIANPSEGRMVGHYWLRAPQLAASTDLTEEIIGCRKQVARFVEGVHNGSIRTEKGDTFVNVMVAGIGGSSLGPLFVAKALSSKNDKMKLFFLDNTDPAGMDRVFSEVEDKLDRTLTVIMSKSGGTLETRNCMEEAKAFYEKNGLSFAKHTVCVTGKGSKLDKVAESEGWLERFPMWDWVGGRTSVMSAVGLVPLCLMGLDMDSLLDGAAACDVLTRNKKLEDNPAAIMAMAWYLCSGGVGGETLVVLPYKDSLELLAKYLQQLIMESLGKEHDNEGKTVNQGLAVLGNKGTSDQHSYVQQLVAGPDNIFVTFVQVLKDREGGNIEVGEGSTSGDYLNAFMLGTKKALESHGKRTMTITVPEVSAYYIGMLIALFERTVGLYANLININAYDQPAVEFGKKAAGGLIELKNSAKALLMSKKGECFTARELAAELGAESEDVFRLMLHLAANDDAIEMREADSVAESGFAAL